MMVTTSSDDATNPGEAASHGDETESLTQSPGRANGRSVLPRVLLKLDTAAGMALHPAWLEDGSSAPAVPKAASRNANRARRLGTIRSPEVWGGHTRRREAPFSPTARAGDSPYS